MFSYIKGAVNIFRESLFICAPVLLLQWQCNVQTLISDRTNKYNNIYY